MDNNVKEPDMTLGELVNSEEFKKANEETLEKKVVNMKINPETGERFLSEDQPEEEVEKSLDESFEEFYDRISEKETDIEKEEITEEEAADFVKKSDGKIFQDEAASNIDFTNEEIAEIIKIANRRIKGEDFNIYKDLPESVRKSISSYVRVVGGITAGAPINSKVMEHMIAKNIIDEFISNINMEKIKKDFRKDIEGLFTESKIEITDSLMEVNKNRLDKFKEFTDKVEDEGKKKIMNKMIEAIEDANNLTSLIEYAPKCKIKNFDLEKPNKHYDKMLNKYANNKYNIFNIYSARQVLYRHLPIEEYNTKDIDALLVAFCKQTLNMKPIISNEHSYMYFFLYNISLLDVISKEDDFYKSFIENIGKVISALRERNKY